MPVETSLYICIQTQKMAKNILVLPETDYRADLDQMEFVTKTINTSTMRSRKLDGII